MVRFGSDLNEHHTGPWPIVAASRGRTYDSTGPECHRPRFEVRLANQGASTYEFWGGVPELVDPGQREGRGAPGQPATSRI